MKAARRPLIPVNADGFDKDGYDYVWAPDPHALAEGLVATREVRLHFPDGHIRPATEILITKKGMARMLANPISPKG